MRADAGDDAGDHAGNDDGGVVEGLVDLEVSSVGLHGAGERWKWMGLCTPNCMSSLPKNIGCPPIVATAASVDTLVLVLRLLKLMATVWPARAPSRFLGIKPDLMACLCWWALRTSVESSAGERSAIERR